MSSTGAVVVEMAGTVQMADTGTVAVEKAGTAQMADTEAAPDDGVSQRQYG